MFELSRRHVIGSLALGAGIVAATGVRGMQAASAFAREEGVVPTARVIRSRDGVLRARLVALPGVADVGGRPVAGTMTYNGQFQGPTLVVRPGDRMRIRLVNRLSTPTNLHFHGFHVSPKGNEDNVYLSIDPGHSYDYDVRIPDDHPGGLYWYHPHRHGYVDAQIWGGMAGLIVVEGGAADLEPVRGLRRRLLAIRPVAFTETGALLSGSPFSTVPQVDLVNNQLMPEIAMRPGETQFWQVANTAARMYYRLAVDGASLTVVERDGTMAWRAQEVDSVVLAPGNRVGLLVTAPKRAGVFQVRQLGYYQADRLGVYAPAPLATVRVQGAPASSVTVPTVLAERPAWLEAPVARRRVLTLSQRTNGSPKPLFFIDGQVFDEITVADVPQVRVGTVEEWVIRNESSNAMGQPNEIHPFHIHVNGMAVIERGDWDPVTNQVSNRVAIDPVGEQDTISVPWNGYLRFRSNFSDFVGRSVYHCHIVIHEDLGMMGAFDIVDADGSGVGPDQLLPSQMAAHGH